MQNLVAEALSPFSKAMFSLTTKKNFDRYYSRYKINTYSLLEIAAKENNYTAFIEISTRFPYPNFLLDTGAIMLAALRGSASEFLSSFLHNNKEALKKLPELFLPGNPRLGNYFSSGRCWVDAFSGLVAANPRSLTNATRKSFFFDFIISYKGDNFEEVFVEFLENLGLSMKTLSKDPLWQRAAADCGSSERILFLEKFLSERFDFSGNYLININLNFEEYSLEAFELLKSRHLNADMEKAIATDLAAYFLSSGDFSKLGRLFELHDDQLFILNFESRHKFNFNEGVKRCIDLWIAKHGADGFLESVFLHVHGERIRFVNNFDYLDYLVSKGVKLVLYGVTADPDVFSWMLARPAYRQEAETTFGRDLQHKPDRCVFYRNEALFELLFKSGCVLNPLDFKHITLEELLSIVRLPERILSWKAKADFREIMPRDQQVLRYLQYHQKRIVEKSHLAV